VSQRLEVALVAELEAAYSSGTAPAVVAHAAPYQWANACHELFEAGRLDITEHAARHLHAIYPELTYLSTLVSLFDAVPRHLPALLAFRDEPAAEIQVVRRSDCDAVLLCFCAREGTLGFPLNFIHEWLGRLPVSLIYIKDFRDLYGTRGYASLGPDRASSVAALRRLARDLGGKRIYVLGASFGGYPALYYGLQVGAEGVFSLGGMTDLTRDFNESLGPLPRHYLNFIQQVPEHATNLRDIYAAAERPPHVLLAFSAEHPRDRPQAERLAGLPTVELISVSGESHHNVVHPLIRKGQFLPLLLRLLSDLPSPLVGEAKGSTAALIPPPLSE
jgi:hypothetical protein